MTPRDVTMAKFMTTGCVISLYIETTLQLAVTLTQDNAIATIISLCIICISFLATSITSFVFVYSSHNMADNQTRLRDKIVFRILHIFQFGMIWRMGQLFTSRPIPDLKILIKLRLVHVAIQSFPYLVIYSSLFFITDNITVVQSLSLLSSIISSSFAITSYNLHWQMCNDIKTPEEANNTGNSLTELNTGRFIKPICAVIGTFLGTVLIISSRTASISLMTTQIYLWVLIPIGLHFLLILIIFVAFSTKEFSDTSKALSLTKSSIYCTGMSILHTFDLVHDNIKHVMCKYVAFYSLFLVENIIFISFWLLSYDFDYVSKLVTVLAVISGFVIGSILKLTGCTLARNTSKSYQDEEVSSPETIAEPAITTTYSSKKLNLSQLSKNAELDLDLVNIVQTSLALHAHHTTKHHNDQNSLPSNKTPNANTKTHNKNSSDQIHSKPSERIKSRSRVPKEPKHSLNSEPSTQEIFNSGLSMTNTHALNNDGRLHRSSSPKPINNPTDKTQTTQPFQICDQNDSFQHSSVITVSDPETLLSDMMYNRINTDVCQFHGDSFPQFVEYKHNRDFNRHKIDNVIPKHITSREISHPEKYLILNHPSYHRKHKHIVAAKSRSSKVINPNDIFQVVRNRKMERSRTMKEILTQDFSLAGESTDNAVSSAKTFPRRSKFDNEMNNILSSIPDGKNTQNDFNPQAVAYRFSDSEAVLGNKVLRSNSANNTQRVGYKNKITYTEPDEDYCADQANKQRTMNRTPIRTNTVISHNSQRTNNNRQDTLTNIQNSTLLSKNRTPAQIEMRLCESCSSSFSTTVTNGNMTNTRGTSTSTTMTTEDCWRETEAGQSSNLKSERLSQFLLQNDSNKVSPSENILRWLSTTSPPALDPG